MAERWHVGCRQCNDASGDATHTHGALARDTYELRYAMNNRGEYTLDEAVARDAFVHLERMSDDSWWLGIYLLDGRRLMVDVWRRKRKVHATADVEAPVETPDWQRHEHDARIAELRAELQRLTGERDEELERRRTKRAAAVREERERRERQGRP